MSRAQERNLPPILWIFKFHPQFRCIHVNFLERTDGTAHDEDEFLLSPHSAYAVRETGWQANPTWMQPHVVVIEVAPDNQDLNAWPESLPTAPWG